MTREDVALISYYGSDREKRVEPVCGDCKSRHLERRKRTRRQRISRGNRAVELAGVLLVGAGILTLLIVIVAAVATRL